MEHAPYLIINLIMKCIKISYAPLLGTFHDKLLINSSHTQTCCQNTIPYSVCTWAKAAVV